MSTTTKIDTGLEKLREALASGDTMEIPKHMPFGMQTYQAAVAAKQGYRSRDAEVARLVDRIECIAYAHSLGEDVHNHIVDAKNMVRHVFEHTPERATLVERLQAEKAELVEGIQAIINRDGMFDHERMGKVAALIAKHGKEGQ